MNIYLVFYTRPEAEDESFLSAHATFESARKAAETDATDAGQTLAKKLPKRPSLGKPDEWRWGIADGRKNPSICGDGQENPNILTDWTDMDDSGRYEITTVPLLGAATILIDRFRQWNKTADFTVNAERRCVDGKIFRACLVGVEDHPRPQRRRKAVRQ